MKNFFSKILRYGFFALVCLVTLVALLVAEENFRAKHDWESYRREHEAHGDRLDLQPLIPPPVPDDQNFAMTPLLRPLFSPNNNQYGVDLRKKLELSSANENGKLPALGDRTVGKRVNLNDWQACFGVQDILAALRKFDPELNEITRASRLPYSRFPIAYEKGFEAELPHGSVLMSLGKIYRLRACAELREGQPDAALADVQTVFRLGNSVKDEPTLISLLVRIAIYQGGIHAVWEGLADHRWPDAQLLALQSDLGSANFISELRTAFRGERGVSMTRC